MVDYETSSLHYQEYLFRCKDIMQYFYIKSICFAVKISCNTSIPRVSVSL